jgi:hypothetical protein
MPPCFDFSSSFKTARSLPDRSVRITARPSIRSASARLRFARESSCSRTCSSGIESSYAHSGFGHGLPVLSRGGSAGNMTSPIGFW